MIKKMGYKWRLRTLMAEHELFHTTDLVPLLAERGIVLSLEQVTQPPQRLSMDVLAALCDILECSPNDLIEVVAAKQSMKKVAGTSSSPPPRSRRTTIRRPD